MARWPKPLRHNKHAASILSSCRRSADINGKKPIVDADVDPLQILNKDQTTSERDGGDCGFNGVSGLTR